LSEPAPARDPLFPFANLSRRQEQVVALLWELRERSETARMSGMEIRQRLGMRSNSGGNLNVITSVARIKLRRIGWDIDSKLGPRGGYRLMRI
jgi:predicted transcriptional regulator